MFQQHGILGIFALVAMIAFATVLLSNSGGTAQVIGSVSNGYSNMLNAAQGKG